MVADSLDVTARCSFGACPEPLTARVIMAMVDQLCAEADIDITLLDALDYPLGESFLALYRFGITEVMVKVCEGELTIELELAEAVSDVETLLSSGDAVIPAFFDVHHEAEAAIVTLVGALQ